MGEIDLRELEGDQIVIHFGGELRSINAYTFANSLTAFADVATAVNTFLNPGQNIELRLETNGPGSYRAVVKRRAKGVPGFFSRGAENLLWQAVGLVVLVPFFQAPDSRITINTDEVIIERGGDRLIIPRAVYDQSAAVEASPEVRRHVKRTFEALENDEAIENFGLTKSLDDPIPLVQLPRSEFGRAAGGPEVLLDEKRRRTWQEKARLIIEKAWFKKGVQKWQFQWNNTPVSAPIRDDEFWRKVEDHEIVFGNGDGLDVEIEFEQDRDDALGMWVNDVSTYRVIRVLRTIPRSR